MKNYIEKEEVDTLVVGWPTNDDGTDTNNTAHVRGFVRKLKKEFPGIPVALQDEWSTSKSALQSMVAAGTKKKSRRNKLNVDQVSATIILQTYLESKS